MEILLSKKERRYRRFLGRLKVYLFFIIFLLLVWGFYYAISRSLLLKVDVIEFRGLEKLTKEKALPELAPQVTGTLLAQLFGFDNLLVWPTGSLIINHPLIASATIEKSYWQKTITVNIQEREKYGTWCFPTTKPDAPPSKCLWFDKQGIVFAEALPSEGSLLLRIESNQNSQIRLGSLIASAETLVNLQKIIETLQTEFDLHNFHWDEKKQDLTTKTKNGPQLFFSGRFDPEKNLAALVIFSKRPQFSSLSIIDLRVENRIYSK